MTLIRSNKASKNYFKYILLIITIIVCGYLFFNQKCIINEDLIRIENNQTGINAFIVTTNCSSARFYSTKQNIERVFPGYFNILCFKPISLNDSRIDKSSNLLSKKLASNLITFVTLWTFEIPKYSTTTELDWSFIFEDDVNFIDPSNFLLPNYITAIEELMHHRDILLKHGAFYLGMCGPKFYNDDRALKTPSSNGNLLSRQGCGRCVHGMAVTTKRARTLWTEMSLYFPNPNGPTDAYLDEYCVKSGNHYYVLGGNKEWPPNSGHGGIAYQDRERFRSGIW